MSRWEIERSKWLKPSENTKKGGVKVAKTSIEEVS
jgi:hypothetical protein